MQRLVVILFPGFEILDAFGPLEFFSYTERVNPLGYEIKIIGSEKGSIPTKGVMPFSFVDMTIDEFLMVAKPDAEGFLADTLLLPGGVGTRTQVNQSPFLSSLVTLAQKCKRICSVCTGSGVLAKAGILNHKRATSNKLAFQWARDQSQLVMWQTQARWVKDGQVWTSSGVAAGMDMALMIIAEDFGLQVATKIAFNVEYVWNQDSELDPFAKI